MARSGHALVSTVDKALTQQEKFLTAPDGEVIFSDHPPEAKLGHAVRSIRNLVEGEFSQMAAAWISMAPKGARR